MILVALNTATMLALLAGRARDNLRELALAEPAAGRNARALS